MFTPKELSVIKLEYFNVIFCASDVCELESHNGDHWMILKIQIWKHKAKKANARHLDFGYQLYHRHKVADGFHLHSEYINVLDAILEIIDHDDYRLGRRGKTYFDEVVKEFA